jgi:hypothetical protein
MRFFECFKARRRVGVLIVIRSLGIYTKIPFDWYDHMGYLQDVVGFGRYNHMMSFFFPIRYTTETEDEFFFSNHMMSFFFPIRYTTETEDEQDRRTRLAHKISAVADLDRRTKVRKTRDKRRDNTQ